MLNYTTYHLVIVQLKDLNQYPWKVLEDAVRSAVSYRKSLFVIAGPVYEGTGVGNDNPSTF